MKCMCWEGGTEMLEHIHFAELTMTCISCPSQWDAWDADGNYYYIRYRFGRLRVDRAPTLDDWWKRTEPFNQWEIFRETVGSQFHGSMTTEEMLSFLTGVEPEGWDGND